MNVNSKISELSRLSPEQSAGLKRLSIETIEDLLYHFPVRYGDTAEFVNIENLTKGASAVVFGKISGLKASKGFRTKIAMAEAWLADETGKIKIVWFNQPYIAKMIHNDTLVRVEGKIAERKGELYFSNPKVEQVTKIPVGVGESLFGKRDADAHTLYPVYPESAGITSNWFYHAVQKIFRSDILDSVVDPIPETILKKYNLPTWKTAMVWIHAPQTQNDALSARKRFAFEEIFFIQLAKQKERAVLAHSKAFVIEKSRADLQKFMEKFSFAPTNAQNRAIDAILADFKNAHPMTRLLEGDVGSGKTAVAAATAYAVATTRPKNQTSGTLQVAYMVPTEVLARQHFESFISYFRHFPIPIALITGSGCRKFPSKVNPSGWTDISRSQLLKWVKNGEIPILIGTHTLIQKSVAFKHLAYVIIDEQHRFGTRQRAALVARGQMRTERGPMQTENTPTSPDSLLFKDLTYRIREAVFAVRKTLGLGHKEVIYQKALAEEFSVRKILFVREARIPVFYNKKQIGIYQPDFVVDEKIIVELKALQFIGATEKKQIWNYLKGSPYELAMLVNFGPRECSIDRIINSKRKLSASGPQLSASYPHLLSMTATPIPRTLSLTVYGDLDLTLLDEMPVGRKHIITEIVLPNERKEMYEKIRAQLKEGRQAFIICPRIDEPDPEKLNAVLARSVKAEAKRLKKDVFQEYELGVLHSKMKDSEKEKEMADFKAGNIDILCATSVVEVGVNVPNATVILIEGAERFGLAQLHQLRGRVIRSNEQAYCFLYAESGGEKTKDRLKALKTAKNGFELAEFDLKFRGSGDLYGKKQWGITDVGMEALQNLKMVEAARTEAKEMVSKDETLSQFPAVADELVRRESQRVHFE